MEHAPLLYRLPGVWPARPAGRAAVNPDDIIGLFDLDTATQSKITRAFLRKSEAAGALHLALRPGASELPRVFLVTCTCTAGASTADASAGAGAGASASASAGAGAGAGAGASTDVWFLTRLPR